MKKLIAAALVAAALGAWGIVLIPTLAHAGAGQPGVHRGEGLKKMAGALGLTDAQKAQMKTIAVSARAQAKAIKQDTTLTADIKKAKLKELHKSTLLQMRGILTPDQIAKLKTLRAQMRNGGDKA